MVYHPKISVLVKNYFGTIFQFFPSETWTHPSKVASFFGNFFLFAKLHKQVTLTSYNAKNGYKSKSTTRYVLKYPLFTFSAKTAWRAWLRRTRPFAHQVQSVTARHRCSGDTEGCSICDSTIRRTSSISRSKSEPKRWCAQTKV